MPPVATAPVMRTNGQTARDAYMRPLQTYRKFAIAPFGLLIVCCCRSLRFLPRQLVIGAGIQDHCLQLLGGAAQILAVLL